MNATSKTMIKIDKRLAIGVILLTVYNISAATQDVVVGKIISMNNIYHLTSSVFLIAALTFSAISAITKSPPMALRSRGAFIDTLWLNVATAVSWLSFYAALALVEPAIVVALIGAINPVATIMLNKILRPQSRILPSDIYSSLGILVVGGYIGWISVSGNSGLPAIRGFDSLIGLTAALISAISLSATTIYSKRLYDGGETTIGIMASRFWVLVLMSFAIANNTDELREFVTQHVVIVFSIAVFGMIGSLYLLQEGTRLCEPQVVEIVLALGPVFTCALQTLDDRLVFSPHSITANIIIVLFVSYGSYFHIKGQANAS